MKKLFICFTAILFAACCGANDTPAARWSEQRANEWYYAQEWPVGFNYVAGTAINQFEMWQGDSFDPATIEQEMGMAEGLGFNTVRIFLHDLVWEADPEGFKQRVGEFLSICERHGLKAIVTFFTNGGRFEDPQLGKQPDAVQGVHNSQWIQSPGAPAVNDPAQWPRLERYVKDIMTTFKDDPRVYMWCLYNEPESSKQGAQSLPLLREVFKWGREVDPSQPLTSPIWICPGLHATRNNFPIVGFLGENCDVMTFHCYYEPEEMETFISIMKQYGRPMVCQEYMGRPRSTFEQILPILKRENAGAISWGLTAGKCNFHLQWSSKAGDPEPEVWFHDIYRMDGTPYSQQEVDFIRSMTADKRMTNTN